MLPDLLDASVSSFVVRIWGGRGQQYQLLIEWKVNLDGLRYAGQQVRHAARCRLIAVTGPCSDVPSDTPPLCLLTDPLQEPK